MEGGALSAGVPDISARRVDLLRLSACDEMGEKGGKREGGSGGTIERGGMLRLPLSARCREFCAFWSPWTRPSKYDSAL